MKYKLRRYRKCKDSKDIYIFEDENGSWGCVDADSREEAKEEIRKRSRPPFTVEFYR